MHPSHVNRGVAVWRSRVYMETDNAHLFCLDARSGSLIWDVPYADWTNQLRRHECASGGQRQSAGRNLGRR